MPMPAARGPCSEQLVRALACAPKAGDAAAGLIATARRCGGDDPIRDDDLQISLTVLYELHYRGLEGVDERWEWDPDLLRARAFLEQRFERAVRELAGTDHLDVSPAGVADALFALTAPDGRPGLAAYLGKQATAEQWVEFVIHRSVYQLKEADPHTWAIPRLSGAPKAALVELQADEYGGGRLERMHSVMYADTMRALGVDDEYGVHTDSLPAVTLAWANVMSLFGLHRRLRGALLGHLAAYEMTSPLPCRLYADGLRRLGYGPSATAFFDEHVEADAVHEQIAGRDLAGGLASAEPEQAGELMFGAAACLEIDALFGAHLLGSWRAGRSSLRGSGELSAVAS
jgi:hypothetical protein